MDVFDAIAHRRTIARFDPGRPIAAADLARLLEAAGRAPSGLNLQPWRFLVVREARNRAVLARACFGQRAVEEAGAVVLILAALAGVASHLGAIVQEERGRGTLDEDATRARPGLAANLVRRWGGERAWASRTAMLAVVPLMLAAESLGLGSALIDDFDEAAVRDAFGIAADHTLAAIVALGYPLERPGDPGRLPLEETCFAEHFGQPWNPEG